jgi:hypothetical protein
MSGWDWAGYHEIHLLGGDMDMEMTAWQLMAHLHGTISVLVALNASNAKRGRMK